MSILEYFGSGAIQTLDSIAPQKRSKLWYKTMEAEADKGESRNWYDTIRQLLIDFDLVATSGIEVGINFLPQLANRFTPQTLTVIFMNTLDEFISRLRNSDKIHYIFVGEFSELGRFHFHGTVSGLSYYQRNKLNRLLNSIGRPDIKLIKNVPAYSTYAIKEYIYRDNALANYVNFIQKPYIDGVVRDIFDTVAHTGTNPSENLQFIITSE